MTSQPITSLIPIISVVNKAAVVIPIITSNINKILIRPGSKTSTLTYVNKIEGNNQIIANKKINNIKTLEEKLIFIISISLPPGIKANNKKNPLKNNKKINNPFSVLGNVKYN